MEKSTMSLTSIMISFKDLKRINQFKRFRTFRAKWENKLETHGEVISRALDLLEISQKGD